MKHFVKAFIVVGLLMLLSALLAACGGAAATGPNQVHLSDSDFAQSSITIKKGQVVTLVNDTATVHVIENGTWKNNAAEPDIESGAPKVDYNMSGYANQTVGPFNTVGTYQIYCTVHPGMNLTVTVQ